MRLLLAEDELSLSRALVKIFERNNYSVDAVHNGEDALSYLSSDNYDCLILDIMMPKKNGFEVLEALRSSGNSIPVLILTAKAEVEDKVRGLDSGANYYLTKPFETEELLAAVRAITRSTATLDTTVRFGNITLSRATFELSGPEGSVRLANKEFQMLNMLMSNPDHLISTERFMERIWGYDSDSEINVVWAYISYLRKKLSLLGANIEIKASRNAGYSLVKNG